jgi:hypothetical protein
MLTSFSILVSFYICSFLILNLNNFLQYGDPVMSTNFLTRVMRKAFTFILISTLLPLLIVTIHASDALSLDTFFGVDGKVTLSFSAGNDVGSGIAVQSDGKIVVVGTRDDGSGDSDFAVARYNPADLSLTGGGAVVEVAAASSQLLQMARLLSEYSSHFPKTLRSSGSAFLMLPSGSDCGLQERPTRPLL